MAGIFLETDYRSILRSEYSKRKLKNPSYSQRAFARDLDISVNRISEILNGKQGLSMHSAITTATRLGFSTREVEYFKDLVLATDGRSHLEREAAKERILQTRKTEAGKDAPTFVSDISLESISEIKEHIFSYLNDLTKELAQAESADKKYQLQIRLLNTNKT